MNTLIVTDSPCRHPQLAFMNTTGGAVCVTCSQWFAAESPEGKRAEAAWTRGTIDEAHGGDDGHG
jgi:hypothetical protein